MFASRALRGLRLGESVAVQGLELLYRRVESEDALVVAAHHNTDQFVGDLNRIPFRHAFTFASKTSK